MSDSDLIVCNGINGVTGDYLVPPLTRRQLVHVITGERPLSTAHRRDLRARQRARKSYSVADGVTVDDLSSAGWGVVFPWSEQGTPRHRFYQGVRRALAPLLALRKEAAARQSEHLYRELILDVNWDNDAPRAETKYEFLDSHKAPRKGPVEPKRMPYYLLLVGGPDEIPFSFQYQLDVQYAVGRLCFDTVEQYASYAASVVAAERGEVKRSRSAAFWAPDIPLDKSTPASAQHLVAPLADWMVQKADGWKVNTYVGRGDDRTRPDGRKVMVDGPATRQRLLELVARLLKP